jgi:hypothetical protein
VFLWALLGAVQGIAATVVDVAGFRRLDWTYEAFCAALLVPAAQAAALTVLVPAARRTAPGGAWREVASLPTVRALLAADALLIAAAFLPGVPGTAVLRIAAALQAAAFGLLVLAAAARGGMSGGRGALAVAGAASLLSAGFATPIPGRLAAFLLPRLSRAVPPTVFGEAGLLALAGILLVAAAPLARRAPAAGRVLEAATAPALAAAAIVALHLFRFPRVAPPWDLVVFALLVAASAIGCAAAFAARVGPVGERP